MKRVAEIIKLKDSKIEEYIKLHKDVPKKVLDELRKCNITNYSIYIEENILFAYFEYLGNNYKQDMIKMANSEVIKKWWKKTSPCQIPFKNLEKGVWWKPIKNVFLMDE